MVQQREQAKKIIKRTPVEPLAQESPPNVSVEPLAQENLRHVNGGHLPKDPSSGGGG